jgi:hypothetical protein
MSKTGKNIAIVAGVIGLAAVIAAVVVLGQLGRLIREGVEEHGPAITGTDVALGGASVSIFSGEGELKNLRIGNPEGYSDDEAFDLGRIKIAVDTRTVASKVVHIRSIVVDGPKLLAEFDPAGRNNLNTILNHVKAMAGGSGKSSGGGSGGGETRMIIDEFRFENAEARALAPSLKLDKTLKLPPVVLRNLGARQGGAAASDIANQILRPIVDATVREATQEYVKAQREKLGDKAKDKLLDKLFK